MTDTLPASGVDLERLRALAEKATPGPWQTKGVSMEDGSISIGPTAYPIVLAYVTNAASFGDFVTAALHGRRDFGAPDTAVTQWASADFIAACDPQTITWVLDDRQRLLDRVAELEKGLRPFAVSYRGADWPDDKAVSLGVTVRDVRRAYALLPTTKEQAGI